MNNKELQQLKALAKAATLGPWLHRHDPGNPAGVQHGVKLPGEFGAWVCDCLDNADRSTNGGVAGERNAAFISAANPAAILALIAKVESLAADAERYRHLRKNALMGYPSCEGSENKDACLVITSYGWEDSETTVDQAVDESIAKEKA